MRGLLDTIERLGNRLPDPAAMFAGLAALVAVASSVCAWFGVSAVHPGTGETVAAVNLLDTAGLRRMLAEATRNFAGFPPLGTVLVAMLGIGVAERSGLVQALLRRALAGVPPAALTAALFVVGINASLAADAGFVLLVPLGAALWAAAGRHPLAGLAVAVASVSGGFSANLLLTALDPLLAGLTEAAARLVDPDYRVDATANWYFMVVSVGLLTVVGTLVNDRVVEPRLGPWRRPAPFTDPDGDPRADPDPRAAPEPAPPATPAESRGLRAAAVAFAAVVALVLVLVRVGVLYDADTGLRPLYDSMVTWVLVAFGVPGLVYGVAIGRFRGTRDVSAAATEAMAGMGSYLVLAFFAAQFIAWFGWSQLGLILAVRGASGLSSLGLGGVPLLLTFVLVAGTANLLLASASAKWAILGPVFVPMFMLLGLSPEVVQLAYRVGDSITNPITPLMPYFPLILAFAARWQPDVRLGTLLALLVPYSLAFLVAWSLLLAAWMGLGLPIGPDAPLTWSAG